MNHFIGRRGITLLKSELSKKEVERIKNELTVTPYQNKMFSGNEEAKPYKIYLESEKYYYVPVHWGRQYYKNLKDKRPKSKKIDLKFNGELRDLQKEVMKDVFPLMDKDNGLILSLQTGQGKTICALYILSQLKVKTMIMVHKEFLMNQWVERIQQFIPDASIGILQQKKCELDNDIVIGMIQTLCSKDYEKNTFNDFGLLIIDETHHMSSRHFSKAMRKFTPKYTLGLTATPNRNDGLTRVFMWSLGMNMIKKERAKLLVNIEMHHFTSDLEEKLNAMGKLNYSRMLNDIADHEERNQYLIKIITKQADDNKKIIILSHRRNHIKYLKEEIDTLNKYTTGYYVGGMKQADLKESEEKQIIFATMSMSEEGLDIPSLNCAILATPKSNVEQAVGRVLRKKSYEVPPLVIDVVDTYSVFFAQANKRKKFYLSQEFDVYRIYPNENRVVKEGKKNKVKKVVKKKKTMIESLFLEDN